MRREIPRVAENHLPQLAAHKLSDLAWVLPLAVNGFSCTLTEVVRRYAHNELRYFGLRRNAYLVWTQFCVLRLIASDVLYCVDVYTGKS